MTYIITFEVFMLVIKNFAIKVRMTVHKSSGFLILEEKTVLTEVLISNIIDYCFSADKHSYIFALC